MKTCPNCLKELSDNFTYCNECGCEIDSEKLGDFKTEYLNVFKKGEGFIYVFAVRGRQVILNADSIDELSQLVKLNRFPWMQNKSKNLLNHEASLVNVSSDEYAIIGAKTLERNPEYSNLDKMFK